MTTVAVNTNPARLTRGDRPHGASVQSAARLGITPKTVETHRRNIMEKLEIDNVPGRVKFDVREGLTGI